MARKPVPTGVDLEEIRKADGVIIDIGRGSIPPTEPTVTEQVRAMVDRMEEDDLYFVHRKSTPPPPQPRTNLGELAKRAYAKSSASEQTGGVTDRRTYAERYYADEVCVDRGHDKQPGKPCQECIDDVPVHLIPSTPKPESTAPCPE